MNSNVKSQVESITSILEATHSAVESMTVGSRVQLKQLAQTVGLAVSMDPKDVLPFVHSFAHKTDIAYVTRGKNGGIVRGTRPAKVVKPVKADVSAPVASDTDTTETV